MIADEIWTIIDKAWDECDGINEADNTFTRIARLVGSEYTANNISSHDLHCTLSYNTSRFIEIANPSQE